MIGDVVFMLLMVALISYGAYQTLDEAIWHDIFRLQQQFELRRPS